MSRGGCCLTHTHALGSRWRDGETRLGARGAGRGIRSVVVCFNSTSLLPPLCCGGIAGRCNVLRPVVRGPGSKAPGFAGCWRCLWDVREAIQCNPLVGRVAQRVGWAQRAIYGWASSRQSRPGNHQDSAISLRISPQSDRNRRCSGACWREASTVPRAAVKKPHRRCPNRDELCGVTRRDAGHFGSSGKQIPLSASERGC